MGILMLAAGLLAGPARAANDTVLQIEDPQQRLSDPVTITITYGEAGGRDFTIRDDGKGMDVVLGDHVYSQVLPAGAAPATSVRIQSHGTSWIAAMPSDVDAMQRIGVRLNLDGTTHVDAMPWKLSQGPTLGPGDAGPGGATAPSQQWAPAAGGAGAPGSPGGTPGAAPPGAPGGPQMGPGGGSGASVSLGDAPWLPLGTALAGVAMGLALGRLRGPKSGAAEGAASGASPGSGAARALTHAEADEACGGAWKGCAVLWFGDGALPGGAVRSSLSHPLPDELVAEAERLARRTRLPAVLLVADLPALDAAGPLPVRDALTKHAAGRVAIGIVEG